ncbi:hypothetical protein [Oceaniglobus indicus]|uniref:hypothetical protein n=1 Tax=Oceaniglobus indicus TaxID=2047749 RepID=UPI000C195A28|nr:hypothetical protein [Oceaniglobus indicus]
MEIMVVLIGGALAFVGLSICRAHWFRLADSLHRLGSDALRRLDWPTAHPFSNVDPNADGQGGALGVFPVRRTRLRVLLHGLPAADLPADARYHERRFRLWGLAILIGVAIAAAMIHMILGLAILLAPVCARLVVPGWPALELTS